MKRKMFMKTILIACSLLFIASPVTAISPIPEESGFSGFIRLGGGVIDYKGNMIKGNNLLDISNNQTKSLTSAADSKTSGVVMLPFELAYTFASTRTQLYLGNSLEDVARFDLASLAGVRQELADAGTIAASFVFNMVITEVWKDPYVVGQDRFGTDQEAMGGRLTWDEFLGTNLQIQYTYRNIDIDDEQSGSSLVSRGLLSAGDTGLLRRDGDRHVGDILYRFTFGEKHRLIPQFRYIKNDLDGGAMSRDGFDFQLTYMYVARPLTFIANGLIGKEDYDEQNPIYDKTREDDNYGAAVQFYYRNPWGWKLFGSEQIDLFAIGFYAQSDADIDFYDTEAIVGTAGVLYRF